MLIPDLIISCKVMFQFPELRHGSASANAEVAWMIALCELADRRYFNKNNSWFYPGLIDIEPLER